MADDAHDDHVHQHDQLHAALTALLAAVPWTPLPLADDAGQDPTEPYATH
jgi:hypothetical protein